MPERAKILVIEDDRLVSRLLRRLLQQAGYEVSVAYSGRAALAALQAERPDLITLDIALPEVDGEALLGELRADPATRSIPVIVISAAPWLLHDRLRRHARAVVAKPFRPEEILRVVASVLAGRPAD